MTVYTDRKQVLKSTYHPKTLTARVRGNFDGSTKYRWMNIAMEWDKKTNTYRLASGDMYIESVDYSITELQAEMQKWEAGLVIKAKHRKAQGRPKGLTFDKDEG